MNRTLLRRTGAAGAAVLALTFGLAACSDDGGDDTATDDPTTSASESESEPTEEETEATGAGAETFGEGCAAIPTTGKGSFDGMVTDPVATAASNNPLLGTLVAAVTEAGLVDTLNTAEAVTVFAPIDDAFAAIPEKNLNALLADKEALTAVLTHHVVAGQLDPSAVVGEHETLNGDMITIEGDETGMTVDSATATVICGNVPTANATVYVIDAVLMPTA